MNPSNIMNTHDTELGAPLTNLLKCGQIIATDPLYIVT